jgi:serine/threonine-protein kinase
MINPGMVLNGRYQLDKQIGEGGFATVFLATDLQLGRKVAVKILSSQM